MLPPVVSHGTTWIILGILLTALATKLPPIAMAALLWTAATFAAVGLAYLFDLRGTFGKRSNGTLAIPNVLVLAPFLLFTWSVWHLAPDATTLIHCAQGHGRTALVATCLLIQRDNLTAPAAIAAVLAARPHARMNRSQRAFVDAFAANVHIDDGPTSGGSSRHDSTEALRAQMNRPPS